MGQQSISHWSNFLYVKFYKINKKLSFLLSILNRALLSDVTVHQDSRMLLSYHFSSELTYYDSDQELIKSRILLATDYQSGYKVDELVT